MSKTFVKLATKDGRKWIRKERPDRRPSDELVKFYSPSQEIEVSCTAEEMENFEQDSGRTLDADVIEDETLFQEFMAYMADGLGLKVI